MARDLPPPPIARIAAALGGAATFRTSVRSPGDLHARILDGIPYRAFEFLVEQFGFERPGVLEVLGVPPRTLARRRHGARFLAEESDRLTRLARIAALAEEVLGSREKAGRWLQKRNRALGGAVPLAHLTTEIGAREVETVLGRAAHGVFS